MKLTFPPIPPQAVFQQFLPRQFSSDSSPGSFPAIPPQAVFHQFLPRQFCHFIAGVDWKIYLWSWQICTQISSQGRIGKYMGLANLYKNFIPRRGWKIYIYMYPWQILTKIKRLGFSGQSSCVMFGFVLIVRFSN